MVGAPKHIPGPHLPGLTPGTFRCDGAIEPGFAYRDVQYLQSLAVTPDNGGYPSCCPDLSQNLTNGLELTPSVFLLQPPLGLTSPISSQICVQPKLQAAPIAFLAPCLLCSKAAHSQSDPFSVSHSFSIKRRGRFAPTFYALEAYTALHTRRRQPISFRSS